MVESDSFQRDRHHPDRVGISHFGSGVHDDLYPEVERGGFTSFAIGAVAFL